MSSGPGETCLITMQIQPKPEHNITQWLRTTSGFWFTFYAASSAFCLYTCIFALRKTFGAATYAGLSFGGVDYKAWMVIFQVVGYMLSKFIGIKVVSELAAHSRAKGILWMTTLAVLAWLCFGSTPAPYNLVFLFLNGLPLGMVWGMVFGYLEGRKSTEVLGASLSVSFIFSAGFAKTVGGFLMRDGGISEFWMPFASSCLFFPPLLLFLWLLNKIPPPSAEDEALRTKRKPMSGKERIQFARMFLPGLVLLIIAYAMLTAFRDFRDNFSTEIWKSLGYGDQPSIFTATELPVSVTVLLVIGSLMVIKNNYKAMIINHVIILVGMVMVGASTLAFEKNLISAPVWMVLVGVGLYFGYIQFNSIFFDRLIATFRHVSTVGFLIYLADSFGYLGSVGVLLYKVLLYKQSGSVQTSWLDFLIASGYALSFFGSALIAISMVYFISKFKHARTPQP